MTAAVGPFVGMVTVGRYPLHDCRYIHWTWATSLVQFLCRRSNPPIPACRPAVFYSLDDLHAISVSLQFLCVDLIIDRAIYNRSSNTIAIESACEVWMQASWHDMIGLHIDRAGYRLRAAEVESGLNSHFLSNELTLSRIEGMAIGLPGSSGYGWDASNTLPSLTHYA